MGVWLAELVLHQLGFRPAFFIPRQGTHPCVLCQVCNECGGCTTVLLLGLLHIQLYLPYLAPSVRRIQMYDGYAYIWFCYALQYELIKLSTQHTT